MKKTLIIYVLSLLIGWVIFCVWHNFKYLNRLESYVLPDVAEREALKEGE